MAKSEFVKKTVRHPLAVGVILLVIGLLIDEGLLRWLGIGPQLLSKALTWASIAIDWIPSWVWFGLVLVGVLIVGLVCGALLHRWLQDSAKALTPVHPTSNLIGITIPIVYLNGRLLEGCVQFNRLERTDPHFQIRRGLFAPQDVYEVVVHPNSTDVQLLKPLVPAQVHGYDNLERIPEVTYEIRDSAGDVGHRLAGGRCVGIREYPSGHLGFLFEFGVATII